MPFCKVWPRTSSLSRQRGSSSAAIATQCVQEGLWWVGRRQGSRT